MVFTNHANQRMRSREISEADVQLTIEYGRTFYARGAVHKVIGKKEIARYQDEADLEHLDGVTVVMGHDGTVITTYRNRRFHRANFRKPRHRPHRNPDSGRMWLDACIQCGL